MIHSFLEELIQMFCPNGVDYQSLGNLGQFYGGLTGKKKEDFVDGNSKFIIIETSFQIAHR